jgi:hypothetical protein
VLLFDQHAQDAGFERGQQAHWSPSSDGYVGRTPQATAGRPGAEAGRRTALRTVLRLPKGGGLRSLAARRPARTAIDNR